MVTNTYQASIEGFQTHLGLNETEAINLIKKSVTLCRKAIEIEKSLKMSKFWKLPKYIVLQFHEPCFIRQPAKIISKSPDNSHRLIKNTLILKFPRGSPWKLTMGVRVVRSTEKALNFENTEKISKRNQTFSLIYV